VEATIGKVLKDEDVKGEETGDRSTTQHSTGPSLPFFSLSNKRKKKGREGGECVMDGRKEKRWRIKMDGKYCPEGTENTYSILSQSMHWGPGFPCSFCPAMYRSLYPAMTEFGHYSKAI